MLKRAYRRVKQEIRVYRFALDDPRTPKKAKWLLRFIFIYFLSPIDLIPDFIPVIGFLDEIILLPGALLMVRRLIPKEVIAESRKRAGADLPTSAFEGDRIEPYR